MKILFFSTVFHPSVGGIQSVVEMLCRAFVRAGHEVRLATLTLGPSQVEFPVEVIRRPGFHSLLSEKGGLVDAIGPHGLTVCNG